MASRRGMELIPYTSREGREIVLRHQNALVVRDPASRRLEVRGAAVTECPTCHRPLRSSSPDRHFDAPPQHDSYMDPDYFRMLQAGFAEDEPPRPPSSPIRRLTQPALPSGGGGGDSGAAPRPNDVPGAPYSSEVAVDDEAEFLSSTPAPAEGARIRRDAFNPNYFQRFFREERELGRGGKGVVLLVRHEMDGCFLGHFACKRVPVGDDHAWLEKVLIEVELLAKLSHPNLVSYRHVWLEDAHLHRFGPPVACVFILQQYCNGGDLLHYVLGDGPKEVTKEQLKAQLRRRSKGQSEMPANLNETQRRLSLEEIYSLFKDITSGLAYLHSANYIHRDLKPNNCLLHRENGQMTCLLSDFGEVQPGNAVRDSTGTTGTISHCAPEVLLPETTTGRLGNFTTKSDIFSLGMILYFLCFGRLPYKNANMIQEELEDISLLRAEIQNWKGFQDERRERPDLPPKLYQLLKLMLALDPVQRPSAVEVLNVMNHESNTSNMQKRSTSPGAGLRNRRIHSLDSPMPPSTPVPEPAKQYRQEQDVAENPSPTATRSHADVPIPTTEEHRVPKRPVPQAEAMALTRSQSSYVQPQPDLSGPARGRSLQRNTSPAVPPLLMAPPPSTFLGALSQRIQLAHHRLIYVTRLHDVAVLFNFRLTLFLVKIITLSRPCRPFLPGLEVGIPLICIAAVDLGMPSRRSAHGSDLLSTWRWGWRVSTLLFALHFLVLWMAAHWRILCTARPEWSEW